MARFKQTTRNSTALRDLSRISRRPAIVESPESESTSCHCVLGHRNLEACSTDPQSPIYSPDFEPSNSTGPSRAMEKRKPVTRGGKKRKAESTVEEEVNYECQCGEGHDTELEYEYARALKKHIEIVTSIIIGSQAMVSITVGTETKQVFLVHKELLALFSGYFQDVFSGRPKVQAKEVPQAESKLQAKVVVKQEDKEESWGSSMGRSVQDSDSDSDTPLRSMSSTSRRNQPNQLSPASDQHSMVDNNLIGTSLSRPAKPNHHEGLASYDLPDIKPSQFAQFVSYLYAGRIIDAFEPLIMAAESNSVEALWYVGQKLRCTSFQNNILEGLRTSESVKSGTWPSAEDIEIVYDLHVKSEPGTEEVAENLLKKFGAHCLGANNPFERYELDSSEGQAWQQLLSRRPELSIDMIKASGRRWAWDKPWDDKVRGNYMVDEVSGIDERWGRLILARRGMAGVKKAASAGDVGAKLEEGHLVAEKERDEYDAEKWLYDSDDLDESDEGIE